MLANASLAAATLTSLYTCGASTRTVAELSLCNTGAADTPVRVAIVQGTGNPAAANWIEYDRVVGASAKAGNGPLTRSITLKPNQALWVYALYAGVTAVLSGIEE